ncbi:MAG: alanine racemase [Thermomicrobiales bacterium]|nr:alanine racemase [Thermomicrobiales bacterium]
MLTTLVGLPIEQLDTPALLVDLDALERNIARMAADIEARGSSWRPHSKANKSPAIAHLELAAGAIGIACAKLGEAEVMAASGVPNIMVPNQVVGPIKARRAAALATQTRLILAVDSETQARQLDEAAVALGTHPEAVIELDTGMNRGGQLPGDKVMRLAELIAGMDGLTFSGVMTWEGHCMSVSDPVEREAAIRSSVGKLVDLAERIRAAGIPVEIVSAGGTGTYLTTASIEGVTEVQAGGGIWGDQVYLNLGANVEPALSIMAQVVSRPQPDRILTDAGRKTVDPSNMPPIPQNVPDNISQAFSAEHGKIVLSEPSKTPGVGDRIFYRVGYSDQCNHLHENFYGVRDGVVEAIWPVLARGRIQ